MTDLSPSMKILVYNEILEEFEATKSIRKACSNVREKHHLQDTNDAFRKWFYRFQRSKGKNHGNAIFSIQEEKGLVAFLEAWSLLNGGLTRKTFLEYVITFRPNESDWNPKNWFHEFIQRHSASLSLRTVKGLSRKRITNDIYGHVVSFASWLENFILTHKNDGLMLINADETRISIEGSQHKMKRIESKKKTKMDALELSRGKSATYIPFHLPDCLLFSVFVIPTCFGTSNEMMVKCAGTVSNHSHPVYYVFNDNGWMNGDTWHAILKVFIDEMENKFGTCTKLLLLDRLSCRMTIDNLKIFEKTHIKVGFIPSHCSHFLQPSDVDIFTTFKNQLYQTLSKSLPFKRPNQRSLGIEMLNIA